MVKKKIRKPRLYCAKITYLCHKKEIVLGGVSKVPKAQTLLFRALDFESASTLVAAYAKAQWKTWKYDLSDVSDVIVLGEI